MWVERKGVLVWLLDSSLDLPPPSGLEWMTADQLDGYYHLFDNTRPPTAYTP